MNTVSRVLVTVPVALVAVVATSWVWSRTHPHVIRTERVIDAPPERVWPVLEANERWSEWNPSIVRSRGRFVEGGTVTNTVRSGDGSMTFTPRVLAVEPDRELRWSGTSYVRGLADGEHSFVLEPLAGRRTRLVQEERFVGALVPFAGRTLDLEDDFEAVNEALARRVEADVPSTP